MSEKKIVFSCCGDENLCEGYTCDIQKTDNGVCLCITSDDPSKVAKLQEKVTSCCAPSDGKSSCC